MCRHIVDKEETLCHGCKYLIRDGRTHHYRCEHETEDGDCALTHRKIGCPNAFQEFPHQLNYTQNLSRTLCKDCLYEKEQWLGSDASAGGFYGNLSDCRQEGERSPSSDDFSRGSSESPPEALSEQSIGVGEQRPLILLEQPSSDDTSSLTSVWDKMLRHGMSNNEIMSLFEHFADCMTPQFTWSLDLGRHCEPLQSRPTVAQRRQSSQRRRHPPPVFPIRSGGRPTQDALSNRPVASVN